MDSEFNPDGTPINPEMNYLPAGSFSGVHGLSVEERITQLEKRMNNHRHSTADRTQPLTSDAQHFTVRSTWFDTIPQTANNFYGTIWIAPFDCTVISIKETHKDAASVDLTMWVYKSGTHLLSTGFDLRNVGGDVVTTGSLTATTADLNFVSGDRLHAGVSGSAASIRGVCLTVEFQPT